MKNFLSLVALLFFCSSCTKDQCIREVTYEKKTNIFKTHQQMIDEVQFFAAKEIIQPGQILLHQDLLCIVEPKKGVHFFDNSTPSNPLALSFLNVEGCHGVDAIGNQLFIDSYLFLVEIDISNIQNMGLKIHDDVFEEYKLRYIVDGQILTDVIVEEVTEFIDCDLHDDQFSGGQDNSLLFDQIKTFINHKRFTIYEDRIVVSDRNLHQIFNIQSNGDLSYVGDINTNNDRVIKYEAPYLFFSEEYGSQVFVISGNSIANSFQYSEIGACSDIAVSGNRIYTRPNYFANPLAPIFNGSAAPCFSFDNLFHIKELTVVNSNVTSIEHESFDNTGSLTYKNNVLFLDNGPDGIAIYDLTLGTLVNAPILSIIENGRINGKLNITDGALNVLYFLKAKSVYQYNLDDPAAPELISILNL